MAAFLRRNHHSPYYFPPDIVNRWEDRYIRQCDSSPEQEEFRIPDPPPSQSTETNDSSQEEEDKEDKEDKEELQRAENSTNGLYTALTDFRLKANHQLYARSYSRLISRFNLRFIDDDSSKPTNIITIAVASRLRRRQEKVAYFRQLLRFSRIIQPRKPFRAPERITLNQYLLSTFRSERLLKPMLRFRQQNYQQFRFLLDPLMEKYGVEPLQPYSPLNFRFRDTDLTIEQQQLAKESYLKDFLNLCYFIPRCD